jgi:hypothetical protein
MQSDVSPEMKISTLCSYILHVRVQYAYIPLEPSCKVNLPSITVGLHSPLDDHRKLRIICCTINTVDNQFLTILHICQ